MNTTELAILYRSTQDAKMDAFEDAIRAIVRAEMAYSHDYTPQAQKSRVFADNKRAYHAFLALEMFLDDAQRSIVHDVDWGKLL